MSSMTDPHDGLISLQEAFAEGHIQSSPGKVDPSVQILLDYPTGDQSEPRITYFTVEGNTVTASVTALPAEQEQGLPCFAFGYAVALPYRNQGRAKNLLLSAIAEMANGFRGTQIKAFYVEAIVGTGNLASQHVAAHGISPTPIAGTDKLSGEPALQYLRKVEVA